MKRNKLIIKQCPNFYKIVNFEYLENDFISEKLIELYQEYIFRIDINNIEDINRIKVLDKVVARYIDDYYFRSEMKNSLPKIKINRNVPDLAKAIIENILKIFDIYEEGTTRKIRITRWI